MKKLLAVVVGLLILGGVAQAAGAKPPTGTGDRNLDATLRTMDTESKADPDGFLKQLSAEYGTPEQELHQVRESHALGGADLFMATAVAKASGKPVSAVAERYKKSEGQGWGVTAQEMGIKPGSKQFQELKKGADGHLKQLKARNRHRHREGKQTQEQEKVQKSKGPGEDMGKGQEQGQSKGKSQGKGKGR
jgi:hypothetical protein